MLISVDNPTLQIELSPLCHNCLGNNAHAQDRLLSLQCQYIFYYAENYGFIEYFLIAKVPFIK